MLHVVGLQGVVARAPRRAQQVAACPELAKLLAVLRANSFYNLTGQINAIDDGHHVAAPCTVAKLGKHTLDDGPQRSLSYVRASGRRSNSEASGDAGSAPATGDRVEFTRCTAPPHLGRESTILLEANKQRPTLLHATPGRAGQRRLQACPRGA